MKIGEMEVEVMSPTLSSSSKANLDSKMASEKQMRDVLSSRAR